MSVDKPSKNEDEYFTKLELEKKRQWEQERAAKMAEGERQKLKELHYMKCPKCGMDLHTIEVEKVSVDRCVSCNGTWFDAGEMEELVKHHDVGLFGRVMSIFK
ncbi:MAG TPA: zf-TFIIB domain-containing protein [Thermoanaerobaculia bacterium]